MTARLACLICLIVPASLQAQPRTDAYGDPLPAHALARLGSTRPQHVWWITALAFAPDGKSLASCDDRTLRLWDVASGKQLQLHRDEYLDSLEVLAFSADGKWLAVGGAGWATIYDVAAGKLHCKLDHEKVPVHHLVFTPDGRFLLIGGRYTPQQWDVASGKLVRQFPAVRLENELGNELTALAAPPGSKSAIFLEGDGNVAWYDLQTGKPTRKLDLKYGWRGVFTPDGKSLIVPSAKEKFGRIDLATGKVVCTFPDSDDRVRPNLSADGKYFVGFEKKKLCCWRLSDGAKVIELACPDGGASHPTLAPDGKSFAYAQGCQLFVIDAATGKIQQTIGKEPDRVRKVSFSLDGKSALVMSAASDGDSSRRQLWNLGAARPIGEPLTLPVRAYYAPVQNHLLANADHPNFSLWDIGAGKKIQTLPVHDPRHPMCFSPDHTLFAAFFYPPTSGESPDRAVRVWQVKTGEEVRTLNVTDMEMGTMAFTPDGQALALACGGGSPGGGFDVKLVFWDIKTGRMRSQRLHGLAAASQIALSPDGRLAAISSTYSDCVSRYLGIFVYEIATGRLLWKIRPSGRGNHREDQLQFSSDSQTLMAAQDADVNLWHAITGKTRGKLAGHERLVTSLALAPDGRSLLTGSLDTTVIHWDLTDLLKQTPTPRQLSDTELSACWDALGDQDPVSAYAAIDKLRGAPDQAVALLKQKLRPIPGPDDATLAKQMNALGHASYAVRQQASAALEQHGQDVLPALEEKLRDSLPLETRRRLEELCVKLAETPPSADELRAVRGAAALEAAATTEARQLLETMAAGPPSARLTREAQGTLRRLAR